MNELLELLIRAGLIGAGATVVMDVWGLFQKHVLKSPPLDYRLLGRWIGSLPRGRFLHENIRQSAPVSGELALGWLAHYAIGITFAGLLLAVFGLVWARQPTLLPALITGLVTVVAPFFILQPAMGGRRRLREDAAAESRATSFVGDAYGLRPRSLSFRRILGVDYPTGGFLR